MRLPFVRDRHNADDHPRVGRSEMELLRGPKEEMEVLRQEFLEVLLPHFCDCRRLVAIAHSQALPKQRADFPIENLHFAGFAGVIFESIGKLNGSLGITSKVFRQVSSSNISPWLA